MLGISGQYAEAKRIEEQEEAVIGLKTIIELMEGVRENIQILAFPEYEKYINDVAIMCKIIDTNGETAMQYIGDDLRTNKLFIMSAIYKIKGKALKYARGDVLRDKKVIKYAIITYPKSILWADQKWLSENINEEDINNIVLFAIKKDVRLYHKLPKEVQENENIKTSYIILKEANDIAEKQEAESNND